MKIEKVNINDLISPTYNPRDMSPMDMEKLKSSIEEFGYIAPIIVNDVNNHIIGGNQRYEAMQQLGFKEVEVSYVHITDQNREKALNIALNKISGDWDTEKLTSIFEDFKLEGFDLNLTGFSDLEITELQLENSLEYKSTDYDENDLEDLYEPPQVKILTCPKCGYTDEEGKYKSEMGDLHEKDTSL